MMTYDSCTLQDNNFDDSKNFFFSVIILLAPTYGLRFETQKLRSVQKNLSFPIVQRYARNYIYN